MALWELLAISMIISVVLPLYLGKFNHRLVKRKQGKTVGPYQAWSTWKRLEPSTGLKAEQRLQRRQFWGQREGTLLMPPKGLPHRVTNSKDS